MTTPVIQPSFSAGELSPSLYGRVDLAKYHVGVALSRNFFVDYRGGLSNRPGTAIVGQCKDSTTANRLIPFQFSTLQTYALVFGNFTMRVVMDGAYVTEPALSIAAVTQAAPGVFQVTGHGYATGNLVFLEALGGMSALDEKFGTVVVIDTNHFSLLDMFGNPISTAGLPAYTGGGQVARVPTFVSPYAGADLALLKFSQSADTMTLTHDAYPPYDLTRTQHWVWTFTQCSFVPSTLSPTNATAIGSSGLTTYEYVVTAIGADGKSESLPSNVATFVNETLSLTTNQHITVSWNGNPGDTLYNIYRTPEVASSAPGEGSLFGYVGSTTPASINTFIDNDILPDFTRTPPMAGNPFQIGQIASIPAGSHGSGYTAPIVEIHDSTGVGAVATAQMSGGSITSITVVNGGYGYTAPTATIADTGTGTGTGATAGTPVLNAASYPACSTYFQQRQIFGALSQSVDGLVMSKTGDFRNMTYSTPSQDDDMVQVTIASTTVNPIKHLVPLTSLVVLTGAGAWRVDGGSQSDAITANHINAVPQAYNGCSDVPPLVINYDILYVQAKGSTVRDLAYNFYVNLYTGTDISMLANHLFFGHQILEWAWAEEPFKLVWAVRDDGILLSLTYLKEQDVYGWARHDTQGRFLSVCAISEGNENAVYVIVERLVQGQYLQYIERVASRNFGGDGAIGIPGDVSLAWFVDAGLQYTLTYPSATLTPAATSADPSVSSVTIVDGGTGYTAPTVSVFDSTGAGAQVSVSVTGGVITGASVTAMGTGYTMPGAEIIDATGAHAVLALGVSRLVAMSASAPIFSGGDVGKIVRVNGGIGTVFSVVSTSQILVDVTQDLTTTWPAQASAWSMTMPVTVISGLDHLDGLTVAVLADGSVQPQQVVVNGTVTLQNAACAITVGLPYTGQVQSLYIDVAEQGGTMQGKRKKINAVSVRCQDTRGLRAGTTFDSLVEIKDRSTETMGQPVQLFTGDKRVLVPPLWGVQGQICVQQDDPLPATLLAFIPEIAVGDS